jgi:hypothetical protein
MLFNSIFDVQEDCLSCHISFDDQIKIVESTEPAYGEYWVQGMNQAKYLLMYLCSLKTKDGI